MGSATLADVAGSAVQSAANALSEMALRKITAISPEARMVDLSRLPMVAGDPERAVVAAYLSVDGAIAGHILLAVSESMVLGLVDMLMGQGTTHELGDPEVSALAEAGNVAGSCFLTTIVGRARRADGYLPTDLKDFSPVRLQKAFVQVTDGTYAARSEARRLVMVSAAHQLGSARSGHPSTARTSRQRWRRARARSWRW